MIIKAIVVPEGATGEAAGSSGSAGNNDTSPNEELIKTCVEKILDIIKDKNGR